MKIRLYGSKSQSSIKNYLFEKPVELGYELVLFPGTCRRTVMIVNKILSYDYLLKIISYSRGQASINI